MLLADWRNILEIWRKVFGDLEKPVWRNTLVIWRNVFGDLEKPIGRNTLAILYWSSLWSSVELGDRKWRLNYNGEKVDTNYGDQNFIYHKVKSTYLERFKDRNV